MVKIYKNGLIRCCLFVMLYLMLISYGYALHSEAPVDKEIKRYCNFAGISKNREKDFAMLKEEADDTPNFKTMRRHLSIFVRIPKEIIDNCPALKNYLLELIVYVNSPTNIDDKTITKNTRKIIQYISQKLEIE